ncbi:MAG TPA: hypothetical protein H9666_03955 [Firmicutes bacterium]|nr:hypothetical protein [Bacillota bacterium]
MKENDAAMAASFFIGDFSDRQVGLDSPIQKSSLKICKLRLYTNTKGRGIIKDTRHALAALGGCKAK